MIIVVIVLSPALSDELFSEEDSFPEDGVTFKVTFAVSDAPSQFVSVYSNESVPAYPSCAV